MFQHDLRQALRWLRANPGFTMAALLMLALSIGITTATLSVVHGVVVRPLPFAEPDRIVRIWSNQLERNLPFFSVSGPDFADWRAQSRAFAQLAAYEAPQSMIVPTGAEHDLVTVSRVTGNIFDLLGAHAAVGRFLDGSESRPGGARVAVIGYGLWQRRFGGRADVLGQTLTLDDEPWTIVGVTAREFAIPNNAAEVWLPMQAAPETTPRARRFLRVLARLRPAATFDAARGELDRIAAELGATYSPSNRGWGISMRPLMETVVAPHVRQGLLVLLGAVLLVLLVACANVAGLLLGRAAARRREMAVRTALGAPRSALIRQMLIESGVLATAGGLMGVLLAMWCVDGLKHLAIGTIPRIDEIGLRLPVVLAAVAITGMTAIIFGLMPAMNASRGTSTSLRTRETTQQPRESRGRDALVLTEIALAVVLLIGAGLLTRSFVHLQNRALGFDPNSLMLVELAASERPGPGPDRSATYDALVSRFEALPGAVMAAGVSGAPFAGRNSGNFFTIVGKAVTPGEAPDTDYRVVTPRYLQTMGIPIVRGRDFNAGDGPTSPVVIISLSTARRYWPDSDPIGAQIQFGSLTPTIVGIAADVRYGAIDAPDDNLRPMMYLPYRLMPDIPLVMVVRTRTAPGDLAAAVRDAVKQAAPRMPIARLVLMSDALAEARGPQQFNATVLGAFAWIALVLAAAGLWGVIAYSVTRRTREIGIRVALGATPAEVMRITAGRGVLLALAGIAIGLVVAAGVGGVLERLLYGVSATDRSTFAIIAAVFLGIATAASVLPARRALRIDPSEALRLE